MEVLLNLHIVTFDEGFQRGFDVSYFFCVLGSNRGEPRSNGPARNGGAPQKPLPIETPAVSLNELNRMTHNFGQKALVGEGSYGRVFYGKLSSGEQAAVKKLDTSSSPEPDNDFVAQVRIFIISIIHYVNIIVLQELP